MLSDFPFADKTPGPEIREKLNKMWADWLAALETAVGKDGWSPSIRPVIDGERNVLELYDWFGGTGTKPTQTGYMGTAGLTSDIALAVDFRGKEGEKGDDGEPGPANQLAGANATTGAPGSQAEASISGVYPNQIIELVIPKGDTGDAGPTPVIDATADTGAPGTDVTVTVTGTPENPVFHFTIPRGQSGSGSGDVVGPSAVDDLQLTQFDGPTGKLVRALNLSGMLRLEAGRPLAAVPGTDYVIPSGTVATAGKWAAPILLNGVQVDGSANVNLPMITTRIASGNFDSITTPGDYNVTNNTDAAAILNIPETLAGSLSVKLANAPGVVQTYTTYVNTAARRTYQRTMHSTLAWGGWCRIYTTIDPPNKTTIGLPNVDNTSDADKPVSTAQAAALADKQATLVSGLNIKTVNDQPLLGSGNINVAASVDEIRKPNNLAPANAATGIESKPVLSASPYFSLYGIPMAASQWQVSTVADFATTVVNTGDVAGTATSYTVTAGALNVSTTYYWRARYKDAEGQYSQWSTPFSFVTVAVFNSYITTPNPTPASFGDAFEGGFYTGMIWNELAQSTTSHASTLGAKTFVVPNMDSLPIVYAGQQLEIRSRTNSLGNILTATVTGAVGTSLTVNVTSVIGGGTFTNWSIMAKFRLIVAPKSLGEVANTQLKNDNSLLPTNAGTITEGYLATESMRLANTSTVYPAAHWARSLSIGGRTDWYIPSRDELELLFRNLKATTEGNQNGNTRPTGVEFDYSTRGAVPDISAVMGQNLNSSPTGAGYTSTVPAQTAAIAFRTGGSEAFSTGPYKTSSAYSSAQAWIQYLNQASSVGGQGTLAHSSNSVARAIRRSVI